MRLPEARTQHLRRAFHKARTQLGRQAPAQHGLDGLRQQAAPTEGHVAADRIRFRPRRARAGLQYVQHPVATDVITVAGERFVRPLPVDHHLDALRPHSLHEFPMGIRGSTAHRFLHGPHIGTEILGQPLATRCELHRADMRATRHQLPHIGRFIKSMPRMRGGECRHRLQATKVTRIDLVVDDGADDR